MAKPLGYYTDLHGVIIELRDKFGDTLERATKAEKLILLTTLSASLLKATVTWPPETSKDVLDFARKLDWETSDHQKEELLMAISAMIVDQID